MKFQLYFWLLSLAGSMYAQTVSIVAYDRSRDFDAVQTIIHGYPNFLMYESQGKPEGTTQKYFNSSHYQTYVLRVDGKTVGFVNYLAYNSNVFTFHFGRYGLINLLGVDTQYQRKGYGKKLLDHAIADLKNQKASRIILAVQKENVNAIAFYTKNGFACPVSAEMYARFPADLPLMFIHDTGIPFDVSRGNMFQRYPKTGAVIIIISVLGIYAYIRWKRRKSELHFEPLTLE